jgi:hypothetical protein
MELQPATLAQVQMGRGGRMVTVDADVGDVVRQLREIDPRLHVEYNFDGGYFVLYQLLENGDEHLVTTAQQLDARLVNRVREISSPDYDYVADLEAGDRQRERDHEHAINEQIGEIGERLFHAFKRDTGKHTDSAFFKG